MKTKETKIWQLMDATSDQKLMMIAFRDWLLRHGFLLLIKKHAGTIKVYGNATLIAQNRQKKVIEFSSEDKNVKIRFDLEKIKILIWETVPNGDMIEIFNNGRLLFLGNARVFDFRMNNGGPHLERLIKEYVNALSSHFGVEPF